MSFTSRLLKLAPIGVALSVAITNVRSAEAMNLVYDLSFFTNGVQVGSGQFSYDPDLAVFVRLPTPVAAAYVAGVDDPIRPDFIPPFPGLWTVTRYPNAVTSFFADLPTRRWVISEFSWLDLSTDGSVSLGTFVCGRSGCGVVAQWFAGSSLALPPGQFAMFGDRQLSADSFTGRFISAPIPSTPTSFVAGTWVATAVPEPTTVAGAILVGVGLLASKIKSHR